MSEKKSENSKMTSLAFAQFALREHVAPQSLGSVKSRLRHATKELTKRNWTHNRVRDCWYADPRISPSAEEIRDLEEMTGLSYGRKELSEIEHLMARADALLDGPDADFYRPWVAGFRAFIGALHRTGTED